MIQDNNGKQTAGKRADGYDRVIMGIDPGTNVMGYGLLGIKGKKPELIVMGVIQLSKVSGPYRKLHMIYERIRGLAAQYMPDEVAIEAPFFGKNVQSMLKLGRAQGVAIAAVLERDIPITEYAPLRIKQAVTGQGSAPKESVAAMLRHILSIPEENMPRLLDATDGLAAALTHFYESGKPKIPRSSGGWAEFIARNPDRLKR